MPCARVDPRPLLREMEVHPLILGMFLVAALVNKKHDKKYIPSHSHVCHRWKLTGRQLAPRSLVSGVARIFNAAYYFHLFAKVESVTLRCVFDAIAVANEPCRVMVYSVPGDRTKKKKRSSAVGSAASAAAASAASSASGRERQRGGAEKTKKKSSLFTDPSSQVAAHAAVAAAILDEERSVKGGSIGGGKKKKKTSSVARPRDSAAREIAVRENNQALRQSASDTADGTMTTKTFDGGHSREEDPGSLTTVTKLPAPKDGVPRLSPATAGGNVPTSAVLKEGSTGSPRVKQRLQDAQDKDRTLSSA